MTVEQHTEIKLLMKFLSMTTYVMPKQPNNNSESNFYYNVVENRIFPGYPKQTDTNDRAMELTPETIDILLKSMRNAARTQSEEKYDHRKIQEYELERQRGGQKILDDFKRGYISTNLI